jgi:hypothetical protein
MAEKVSIEECRRILGSSADGKTDAQIEVLRDELTVIANQMFDHLQSKVRVDRELIEASAVELPGLPATSEEQLKREAIDRIRWIAHDHENGPSPDDFTAERIDDKGAK